jgi:hypothetical protein
VRGPIVADAGAVAEPVLVTAFAGPFYPWSWAEPQLRHLEVEFAAGVAVSFVPAAQPSNPWTPCARSYASSTSAAGPIPRIVPSSSQITR